MNSLTYFALLILFLIPHITFSVPCIFVRPSQYNKNTDSEIETHWLGIELECLHLLLVYHPPARNRPISLDFMMESLHGYCTRLRLSG